MSPPGAFFDDAVMWARLSGITTGVGGNRFDPYGSVSRGQMVTFLRRSSETTSPAALPTGAG